MMWRWYTAIAVKTDIARISSQEIAITLKGRIFLTIPRNSKA